MRTYRILMLPIIAAAFMAVIAGCGGGDDATDGSGAAAVEPQRLTVVMSELKFEPAVLTVQSGRPVHLTIKNHGTTRHDFVISGLPAMGIENDVDEHGAMLEPGMIMGDAEPRHEARVAFTPTTTRDYEVYCSVTGHKDAGMRGMLRVQ